MNLSQRQYNRRLAVHGNFDTVQSNIIPYRLECYSKSHISEYVEINHQYRGMGDPRYWTEDFEEKFDYFVAVIWHNRVIGYRAMKDNELCRLRVHMDYRCYGIARLMWEHAISNWKMNEDTKCITNNSAVIHLAQYFNFIHCDTVIRHQQEYMVFCWQPLPPDHEFNLYLRNKNV